MVLIGCWARAPLARYFIITIAAINFWVGLVSVSHASGANAHRVAGRILSTNYPRIKAAASLCLLDRSASQCNLGFHALHKQFNLWHHLLQAEVSFSCVGFQGTQE